MRKGEILNAYTNDATIQGIHCFFDTLASEPRLSSTAIQTVGNKGYDGFTMSVVM